jgi:bifunctional UDP-N-acetylglucosamine pyrophosphorylase / glucosamine-1-phosphate N-acetyltransferase
MNRLTIVILAAGQGTRMKSDLPKPLHRAAGKPLCEWAMMASAPLSDKKPVLVVGNGEDLVRAHFGDHVEYAIQSERKGTGHAALMAKPFFKDSEGLVMIIAGDMPLLTPETLKNVYDAASREGVIGALLCAKVDDPTGYGRLVTNYEGYASKIVEEKDASADVLKINKVNASVYCIQAQPLLKSLESLSTDNAQGEYYLTDIVEMLAEQGERIVPVLTDAAECIGVNDRKQLNDVSKILYGRKCDQLMAAGVTLINPESTFVCWDATVENDVTIYPNVMIQGPTVIKKDATIFPNCRIKNSVICEGATVEQSVVIDTVVGKNTSVGPFAFLRPGSEIGDNCRIGDFVEVKNSQIGDGTKVSHLTYIGDAEVGKNTNVGCGVVFVNYNGKDKFKTTVGDNCFIGCNTNLIAPVTLGNGVYTAAGSTITKDVPDDSLAIARSQQTIKQGWKKYRKDQP